MLMALLYDDDGHVVAAAPACDQVPYGDTFWLEYHEAVLGPASLFETAYVTIANRELREKLLLLGIDGSLDRTDLTLQVESCAAPSYLPGSKAA